MFAEQTFHDTEGVISCAKCISCCGGGATFHDGNAVIPCPYGLVKCQKKEQQRKKGQWGGRRGQGGGVSGKSISALTRMHFYGTL